MAVTIGLPVGSDLDGFEQAVRSVFAQTDESWKLLIVCDGSPEAIVERALAIDDDRVMVVVGTQNEGLAFRLNQISQLAQTEYVMRMDGDDIMHPSRLELQMRYLSQHPDVDVLGSGSYLIDEKARVCGSYKEPALPNKLSGFLANGVFSHPTVVFKREWSIANPYETKWLRTEDKELWLRAARASRYAKIEDRLVYCRVPVALSITKQSFTAGYDRKLVRTAGRAVASQVRIAGYILKSHIKQFVFRCLVTLGQSEIVHRSKYHPLNAVELAAAELDIRRSLSAEVRGWNS